MRAMLRRWLGHAGASEDDEAGILAAVGEAAANAIEHAGLSPRQVFTLAGQVTDGTVVLTVSDPGRWREGGGEGRGRGMPMMRELMDDMDAGADRGGHHGHADPSAARCRRTRRPSRS